MASEYSAAVGPQLEELPDEELFDVVGGNSEVEPYITPTVAFSITVVSSAISSFGAGIVASHFFGCQKD